MKILPTELRIDGHDLKQITRMGDMAIYKKDRDGVCAGWEVVVIGRHDGYTIAGKTIEPAETYPSNEAWGSRGWSYRDEGSAREKFDSLTSSKADQIHSPQTPTIQSR